MQLIDTVRYMQMCGPGRPGEHCDISQKAEEPVAQSKSDLAKANYKPSTQAKQIIADASEAHLAKNLGIPRTADNKPFDLQSGKVGVEIKTLIDNKNDKITMHPESRERKLSEAKRSKLRIYTVVVDARVNPKKYYWAKGVGSFRVGSMKEASIDDLKKVLK